MTGISGGSVAYFSFFPTACFLFDASFLFIGIILNVSLEQHSGAIAL
jgi:hypothetical protein